jgi:hypothetical protein
MLKDIRAGVIVGHLAFGVLMAISGIGNLWLAHIVLVYDLDRD